MSFVIHVPTCLTCLLEYNLANILTRTLSIVVKVVEKNESNDALEHSDLPLILAYNI